MGDMAEQADAFGIDVFTLDDRLRLFSFATAPQRTEYLSVLRAFERARANYLVLLHASDVNRSDKRRRGYATHYVSSKVRYTGPEPKPEFLRVSGRSYPGCI